MTQFKAHELIQMMPAASPLRHLAVSSVKFDMGSIEDVESLASLTTRTFFEVPYPVCLFQVDQGANEILFFLALREEQGVVWTSFAMIQKQLMKSVFHTLIFYDGSGCENYREGSNARVGWEEMNQSETDTVKTMHTFASAIEVFSCCNVTTIEQHPPKFINAKRNAKGKVPFFSHRTLHINLSSSQSSEGISGNMHASPRLHLRRGHIRRLATKSVWVQSSVVGNKSNGIASKDYCVHRHKTVGASTPVAIETKT